MAFILGTSTHSLQEQREKAVEDNMVDLKHA
jgi:hypothetical protein